MLKNMKNQILIYHVKKIETRESEKNENVLI